MQYQGGKHIAAPHIVSAMMTHGAKVDMPVIEPFIGGGSVTTELCRQGFHVWASDCNRSLITMWREAVECPLEPFALDRDSYQEWKTAPDSALKAIVGFGASFRGKWFGGMASGNNRSPSDYVASAVKTVNAQAAVMKGSAEFRCIGYQDLPMTKGAVYYLDPPYEGTTKHSGIAFDHDAFWKWAAVRATQNLVFVSEYKAPIGRVIMEIDTPLSMAAASGSAGRKQTERLFLL